MTLMELKLGTQKVKRMGEYHYISIPKAMVDSGAVEIGEEYDIVLDLNGKRLTLKKTTKEATA